MKIVISFQVAHFGIIDCVDIVYPAVLPLTCLETVVSKTVFTMQLQFRKHSETFVTSLDPGCFIVLKKLLLNVKNCKQKNLELFSSLRLSTPLFHFKQSPPVF